MRYCLFPSPFCGEHRKEAGTVPRAEEKEGDTSRERKALTTVAAGEGGSGRGQGARGSAEPSLF